MLQSYQNPEAFMIGRGDDGVVFILAQDLEVSLARINPQVSTVYRGAAVAPLIYDPQTNDHIRLDAGDIAKVTNQDLTVYEDHYYSSVFKTYVLRQDEKTYEKKHKRAVKIGYNDWRRPYRDFEKTFRAI